MELLITSIYEDNLLSSISFDASQLTLKNYIDGIQVRDESLNPTRSFNEYNIFMVIFDVL